MLDTYKFIENYKRISIIGMEKNVGKTTLLNKLIADIGKTKKLGLTSIGRDGEDIDVVTNTDKPRIYVRKVVLLQQGEIVWQNVILQKKFYMLQTSPLLWEV